MGDDASRSAYDAFASRVIAGGIVTDPWLHGEPRLSPTPVVLDASRWEEIARVAERVAQAYDEVCQLVLDEPALLEDFFGLTPFQQAMWRSSAPHWHGIARADVFLTPDGPVITELNSDTPTGEAEAVVLSALALAERPDCIDPSSELETRFVDLAESLAPPGGARVLGLVYPTEFSEDLSLIRLYQRWFSARGWDVVLGSPYNLGLDAGGRATLFDTPISLMLRHYKTDWWGERESAWDDDAYPDREPLREPLGIALAAELGDTLTVLNPFGAVVPQNKRSMALMWERLDRFSAETQATIRAHVPPSFRAETLDPAVLRAEQRDWVLKSDYGAEGDEVILGRAVTPELWAASLAHARPGRWIVQQCFEPLGAADGAVDNYGVYVVGGRRAGVYTRRQRGATDERAVSHATLVRRA